MEFKAKLRGRKMKKKVLLVVTLILLVAIVVIFIDFHRTHKGAIRFYILFFKDPWAISNVTISPGDYVDQRYGQQYIVEGYTNQQTGMEVRFFYLRKNRLGLWEVTSAGTGP